MPPFVGIGVMVTLIFAVRFRGDTAPDMLAKCTRTRSVRVQTQSGLLLGIIGDALLVAKEFQSHAGTGRCQRWPSAVLAAACHRAIDLSRNDTEAKCQPLTKCETSLYSHAHSLKIHPNTHMHASY